MATSPIRGPASDLQDPGRLRTFPSARMGPFIAWLATRIADEPTRRH